VKKSKLTPLPPGGNASFQHSDPQVLFQNTGLEYHFLHSFIKNHVVTMFKIGLLNLYVQSIRCTFLQ